MVDRVIYGAIYGTIYPTIWLVCSMAGFRQNQMAETSHSANQLPLALIEGLPASGNHKMVRFPHVQRPVAVIVELVENLLCNVTRPVSRL